MNVSRFSHILKIENESGYFLQIWPLSPLSETDVVYVVLKTLMYVHTFFKEEIEPGVAV